MNRGEVWWGEHPEAGRRPYLLVTRQSAIPVMDNLLCVPATRTVRGIPTEVVLDESDGMPQSCVVSLDNFVVMPKTLLVERICRLRGDRLVQVCRAISVATGCS